MSFKIIEKAKQLASEKHKYQKYGDKPYMYHVEKVAEATRKFFPDDYRYEVVAYLHDVPEDTDVEIEDIEFMFDKEVARNVSILTDERGENRRERKLKTNKRLKDQGADCIIGVNVKCIDRVENIKEGIRTKNISKLKMYKGEHDDFMKAISHVVSKKILVKLIEIQEKMDNLLVTEKRNKKIGR